MRVGVVGLEGLNHGPLIVHSPLGLNDDSVSVPVCKGQPPAAAVQLQRPQLLCTALQDESRWGLSLEGSSAHRTSGASTSSRIIMIRWRLSCQMQRKQCWQLGH